MYLRLVTNINSLFRKTKRISIYNISLENEMAVFKVSLSCVKPNLIIVSCTEFVPKNKAKTTIECYVFSYTKIHKFSINTFLLQTILHL